MLSDAAPRLEGGAGGSVLAWNFLQALRGDFAAVATHIYNVWRNLGVPLVIYPDTSIFWLRRCLPIPRVLTELLVFTLWLPRMVWVARRQGCRRIFALFGADPWFLLRTELLRRASGLPLDIYLIDDLEESTRLSGRRLARKLNNWAEPRVLRKANRVFTISPGYAEHLQAKYGQAATWLPIPAQSDTKYTPCASTGSDRRNIVFLGSVNALYLDSLVEVYRQITLWNDSSGQRFKLCLQLFTRTTPHDLLAMLAHQENLELHLDSSPPVINEAVRTAWCIFLPYSFSSTMKVMVATSFSTKFTESINAGRPILVYGPAYASIPRYFRENGLPLCAHTPDELAQALRDLESHDRPELIERYRALVHRNHSPTALRSILFGEA